MTTIYVTSSKPRAGRSSSRKGANAKKTSDGKPSPVGKFRCSAKLADSLLKQFECVNTNNNEGGVDDSVEVQFLDYLLDGDDKPIVPSICRSLRKHESILADQSLNISNATDETLLNTSAEASLPDGAVGSPLNLEHSLIKENGEGAAKENDGYSSFPELNNGYSPFTDLKNRGWVPKAVTDVLDNVASSNWQCWNVNPPHPTPKESKGKEKRKDKKPKQKKSKQKEVAKPLKSSDSTSSSKLEPSKRALFQSSKKALFHEKKEEETTPKSKEKGTKEPHLQDSPHSFNSEPLMGRQLFGLEEQLAALDDGDCSQSTVMTSNNSSLAPLFSAPVNVSFP